MNRPRPSRWNGRALSIGRSHERPLVAVFVDPCDPVLSQSPDEGKDRVRLFAPSGK